jgi:chemotaxis protein methyltransferase WspC
VKAHPEIAALLKTTMGLGLDIATIGGSALDHAARSRMAALGMTAETDYWERLRSSPDELQELIETIVVPETWFFRDRGAFTALAAIVANDWRPTQRARALRILSVPCSTGEEPCSIAMALLDAGLPRDRFTVDGIDISERSLTVARAGTYGQNSFRGDDLVFRDRHFHRRQNRYALAPVARECVHYRQGNLLSAAFLAEAEPYDVVFCRNVLIYFDPPTQQRVVRTLERLLAKDGLLFVGPSEPFLLRQNGFISTGHSHAFAYRKSTDPSQSNNASTVSRKLRPARRSIPAKPPIQGPPRRIHVPTAAPALEKSTNLNLVTELADAGRLPEAARACEEYLREHGPSAAAYYLLGLIQGAMGFERQAGELYRKTIYLDPTHVDALMHLALFAQKQGDMTAAHRLQNRAQRIHDERRS